MASSSRATGDDMNDAMPLASRSSSSLTRSMALELWMAERSVATLSSVPDISPRDCVVTSSAVEVCSSVSSSCSSTAFVCEMVGERPPSDPERLCAAPEKLSSAP